jgi:hypothetical protein
MHGKRVRAMAPINIKNKTEPIWPLDASLLLHPNIPGGAAKLNPRSVLGVDWWDATRRSSEEMNNHCCYACGVHKSDTDEGWLEGHETYVIDYENHVMKYRRTVSLCSRCHSFIHSGLLLSRLVHKDIDAARYVMVVLHGIRVLRNAQPPLDPAIHQIMHMMSAVGYLPQPEQDMMYHLIETFPEGLISGAQTMQFKILEQFGKVSIPQPIWKLHVGMQDFTHKDIIVADETTHETLT